jgi:chitinase
VRRLAGLLCTFAVALLVPVGVAYAEPVVSTGDEAVFEGDSGVVQIAFHFTLSEPSPETLAVLATTFDVTATAGSDYEPVQKFVSFAPGETTATLVIDIDPDIVTEPDETFVVDLVAAPGVTTAQGQVVGTISNDDGALSIQDGQVDERSSSSVRVHLSRAVNRRVTVDYATSDGTAAASTDYTPSHGTLTFEPGETQHSAFVAARGDAVSEPDETFEIVLSNPQGADLARARGTVTVHDKPVPPAPPPAGPVPSISIGDATAREGPAAVAHFTATLSEPVSYYVTFVALTQPGSALAFADYKSLFSRYSFAPGTTTATVDVPVVDDSKREGTESFVVVISGLAGATVADGSAVGTIADDDPVPCVVPKLTRVRLATAKARLRKAGCEAGSVTHRRTRTVRAGLVMTASRKAGAVLARGAHVGLVVASAPKHRRPRRHG